MQLDNSIKTIKNILVFKVLKVVSVVTGPFQRVDYNLEEDTGFPFGNPDTDGATARGCTKGGAARNGPGAAAGA